MALVIKGLKLNSVDNDTIYDDSALTGRVEALEQKTDNDTIYDDTALSARVTALESKTDKDTVYDDTELTARVTALEESPSDFPSVTWEDVGYILTVGYDTTKHEYGWLKRSNQGGRYVIDVTPNSNETISNWRREFQHTLVRDSFVKALKDNRPVQVILHNTQAGEVEANGPFGYATMVFNLASYMFDVNDDSRLLIARFVNPIFGATAGNVIVYHAYADTTGQYAGYMVRE